MEPGLRKDSNTHKKPESKKSKKRRRKSKKSKKGNNQSRSSTETEPGTSTTTETSENNQTDLAVVCSDKKSSVATSDLGAECSIEMESQTSKSFTSSTQTQQSNSLDTENVENKENDLTSSNSSQVAENLEEAQVENLEETPIKNLEPLKVLAKEIQENTQGSLKEEQTDTYSSRKISLKWEPQPSCSKDPDPPPVLKWISHPGCSRNPEPEKKKESRRARSKISGTGDDQPNSLKGRRRADPLIKQALSATSSSEKQPVEVIDLDLPEGVTAALLKHKNQKPQLYSSEDHIENAHTYVYRDSEDMLQELAELYSYSEESSFCINFVAFETMLESFGLPPNWILLSEEQKNDLILRLLHQLEVADESLRVNTARCILYIAQGSWANSVSEKDHREILIRNGMLLYRMGTFSSFIDLLQIEINKFCKSKEMSTQNSSTIMIVLNVLYTMTEVVQSEKNNLNSSYKEEVETFCTELLFKDNEELLIVALLNLLVKFGNCHTNAKYFPIKKLLVLLWKLILLALGGLDKLEEMKKKKRKESGLSEEHDDDGGTDSSKKKKPKAHQSELEKFLDYVRKKYIGYKIDGDYTTLAGLPDRILSSVETISRHLYTPLSQLQIEQQRLVESHPLTHPDVIELTPTEILYQELYPHLEQYVISLLKIMSLIIYAKERKQFTCKPEFSGLSKTDNPTYYKVIKIDSNRYEEIILKAVSAILLLLLKHLKLNHVYQFEHMCRLLEDNNAITILVAFFNRDLAAYIRTVNDVPDLNFPTGIIRPRTETLNMTSTQSFSSRTMFITINILRILNKIIKWKDFRIQKTIPLKSIDNLRQCVFINNRWLKTYAFKLLKLQMRYQNLEWKQENMPILKEIFCHVRLHLNDNYLELPSKKERKENNDNQALVLRTSIDDFHNRRYQDLMQLIELSIVTIDNCIVALSGGDSRRHWFLPDCLREALYRWLDRDYLS